MLACPLGRTPTKVLKHSHSLKKASLPTAIQPVVRMYLDLVERSG